jgi:acetyl-CoA acyltransferase
MRDAFVVGIDMTPFGRRSEQSLAGLGGQASLLALDDAGLALRDIQAIYCGNSIEANRMVGQRILREIGESGVPVVNVASACATGGLAFRDASIAVQGGLYDLVLAVGVEQMGRGILVAARPDDVLEAEGVLGSSTPPAMFAAIGLEHQRRHGTTFEQFAKVAVKNHRHATLNPKAMVRRETPLEEVMASEMIAYPNTKLMCSLNADGAAAAVIASGKAVRRLGLGRRAIRILASEAASNPYAPRGDALTDFSLVTRNCAASARERSGVGPADLHLVELHDCFATAEIIHYENLALCPDGDGGRLIDDGVTALGGAFPVNVSGGLLSKGHPLGATGIAGLCEIALQVRGEAGSRQVEGAKLGLAHVVGGGPDGGAACVIHVLEGP